MKLGTLCYVEKDDRYLMLHRIKKKNDMHKDLWVGLGGKLEAGESPEDCVVREVYEESGLIINKPRLRGVLTFPSDYIQEDWYVFLFTSDNFTGELRQCDEGELAWIDKGKLNELPMHKSDYHFLRWIQANNGIISAKYTYEYDVFKDMKFEVYNC